MLLCSQSLSIDINSRMKFPHWPEGKKGGETERGTAYLAYYEVRSIYCFQTTVSSCSVHPWPSSPFGRCSGSSVSRDLFKITRCSSTSSLMYTGDSTRVEAVEGISYPYDFDNTYLHRLIPCKYETSYSQSQASTLDFA